VICLDRFSQRSGLQISNFNYHHYINSRNHDSDLNTKNNFNTFYYSNPNRESKHQKFNSICENSSKSYFENIKKQSQARKVCHQKNKSYGGYVDPGTYALDARTSYLQKTHKKSF
jgi:hypothetical protein